MAISATEKRAWEKCPFCSQSDNAIAGIIRDESRWDEIPFGCACGWKRVCQVAFRKQILRYEKSTWSDLCSARSDANNSPSLTAWEPSEWLEGYCKHYSDAAEDEDEGEDEVGGEGSAEDNSPAWIAGFIAGGIYVGEVQEGTPAELAELLPGDVIIEANGTRVQLLQTFQEVRDAVEPGEWLDLRVIRNGEERDVRMRRPT